MERLKFALTSDQLELLIAFENSQGLGQLAETMAKDPSVISRNLQRIAEDFPVLKKVKGRWQLTPLGIQLNEQTRAFLTRHRQLLPESTARLKPTSIAFDKDAALIVVNAQRGLLDATQENRNNSQAELNIARLLQSWRSQNRPIVHVKHISTNPSSSFYRGSSACEFLESLAPLPGEIVVEKTMSSAFASPELEPSLNERNCSQVILVGFTANDCIDASVRDAVRLGFDGFVVGDATATFDLRDQSGRLVKAERIHKLTLANIHAFYAKVVNTDDILS